MKLARIFVAAGLIAILLALAGLYINLSKNAVEADTDANLAKPPVTATPPPVIDTLKVPKKSVEEDSQEVDPYGELPEHIQQAIKFAESKTMSESIDGMVNSSQEESARMKKVLEEMGQGETLKYLRNYVEDYSGFYNTSVIGENQDQRKAVRAALKEDLAIFMASRGLDQARVEKLESLDYNVVEGGERSVLLNGNVKDFIALSEDAKFGLNNQGKECLFFTSSNLKQFRERVNGSRNESSFDPYCATGNGFGSSNPLFSDRTYNKNELEGLIKQFNH